MDERWVCHVICPQKYIGPIFAYTSLRTLWRRRLQITRGIFSTNPPSFPWRLPAILAMRVKISFLRLCWLDRTGTGRTVIIPMQQPLCGRGLLDAVIADGEPDWTGMVWVQFLAESLMTPGSSAAAARSSRFFYFFCTSPLVNSLHTYRTFHQPNNLRF